jgi:hypothetical protein
MVQVAEVPELITVASGSTDTFATGFSFETASEVQVWVDPGTGYVLKTAGVHYDIPAGDWLGGGGVVVFRSGQLPESGDKVKRRRVTPLAQLNPLGDTATFRPELNEKAFDRTVRMLQELQRDIDQVDGGTGGGGDVAFASWDEVQAGAAEGKAIDPVTAFQGMPAAQRDVVLDARPDPVNADDSGGILAMFDGDQDGRPIRLRSRLRGQGVLGAPTTGYKYTPETALVALWLLNRAGHNQDTDSNDGRTGAAAIRVNISATFGTAPATSKADGDTVAFNFSGFCNAGPKAGGTHFLANPAIVGVNGDLSAGSNYCYLQGGEVIYKDNGFDISAIHDVANLERSNGTGGQGCVWIGARYQSTGVQPIDAFWSAVGPAKIGLDLSTGTYTQAAVALAADQTINFDATNADPNKLPDNTVVGDTYLKFNGTTDKFEFFIGGTKAFEFGASGPAGSSRGVATLTANATTWTITTTNVLYITANSSATLVTGIAAGLPVGTEFIVYFNDANTTLDSNIVGGFSLNGFLDVTPPLGAWMRFVRTADNVLEIGRSFGGLVPGFSTFPDGFSTPEVQSGRPHYKASNASATTITNFLLGNGSQQITILATNDNTTIQHNGTTISLIGGASVVIPSGHTMTLIRDGTLWREVNRTFPTTGWGSLNTGTTPSIVGLAENVVMIHGGATSITNFTGGSNGRVLRLHFTNSNVTLVHGSSLKLRGGSNVTPSADQIITLIRDYVGGWIEVSRNF